MTRLETWHDLPRALQQFREDAYDVSTELTTALANLDEWQALGFPNHTPGSNPSSAPHVIDPDDIDPETGQPDPVDLMPTERAAHRAGRETYLAETTRLMAELNDAMRAVEKLAIRVRKHAYPARVKPGEVNEKLRPECWVHAQAGFTTVDVDPRGSTVNKQPVCRRCSEFWKVHGVPMPAELIRHFEDNGKIAPSVEADVMRRLRAASKPQRTPVKKRRRNTGLDRVKAHNAQVLERGTTTETSADMAARFTNEHGGPTT